MSDLKITPKSIYLKRRSFIKNSFLGISSLSLSKFAQFSSFASQNDKPTSYEAITSYNNFYEFGTSKSDPKKNAFRLTTHPWSVEVGGLCRSPKTLDMDDIFKLNKIEERVYRFRCVEGWSMVIPWTGFSLRDFLLHFEPDDNARYVKFETLYRPEEMIGQKSNILDWPYVEGLRMDEAMHPLSFLSTGIYGESLLNQNGAPLRLVTPWKYGFKSIKSIVKISFERDMPLTSWVKSNPKEYGFYSNVNPDVDHPRWSQKTERRIGEWLRRKTLMYNGYGEEVNDLYKNMDLKKWF
ncbi:protein-methionine-sulfoxide reductase catalytic subunit MsrP [bacterium]|nr:protein-methionine-sulfoxide reductase catalytic subunit MsrP [bacterium]|tara:strand:+ start:18565 stop:19449 length:885 start_codon:yes stop_codon:yes gene_type:complete